MDKKQSELTDRIRSSIKKKLVEINAFVDDELPDYIMILVANKRSKSHMKKDLSLFLGKDTATFTDWLWNLVNNLKVKSSIKEKNEEANQVDKVIPSDEDVLDYDPNEQEGDFLYQEENSTQLIPKALKDTETLCPKNGSHPSKTENLPSKTLPVKSTNKVSGKDLHEAVSQKYVKVYPVQPFSQTTNPVSHMERINPDDEYDPTKPEFSGTISSVVRVTERKYSRPASLQVNKLLQRAVEDATKSVLDGRSVDDFYKPTPIKVLSSTRRDQAPRSRNLVNVKIDSNLPVKNKSDQPSNDQNSFESIDIFKQEKFVFSGMPQNNRTIQLASEQKPKDDPPIFPEVEYFNSNIEQEVKESAPQFTVTLDGVSLPSYKRKFTDSEESMDIDDEHFDEEDYEANPGKKLKVTEKCKYWPSCKNNDDCVYHHPTVQCKCFPDCKYGDRCFYIHPNCKFDALCSRKDCPYTHASKRKFPLRVAIPKSPVNLKSTKAVCKFYPKCTVKNCAFIHPKFCRYGTTCRLPMCPFTHLNIPPRNQMKWKANTTESL